MPIFSSPRVTPSPLRASHERSNDRNNRLPRVGGRHDAASDRVHRCCQSGACRWVTFFLFCFLSLEFLIPRKLFSKVLPVLLSGHFFFFFLESVSLVMRWSRWSCPAEHPMVLQTRPLVMHLFASLIARNSDALEISCRSNVHERTFFTRCTRCGQRWLRDCSN